MTLKKTIYRTLCLLPWVSIWLVVSECGYAILNDIASSNGPFQGWTLHADGMVNTALNGPKVPFWQCTLITLIAPALMALVYGIVRLMEWLNKDGASD